MKRILAFLLALVMVLGMFPASTIHVHAEEPKEEIILEEETLPEDSEDPTKPDTEEPTVPEETAAPTTEETEPETTVPQTEETEPTTTVPETKETEPTTTVPETKETQPAATVPEIKVADSVANAGTEAVTYDLTDGILTISGIGPMEDYASASDAPWYTQRASITKVVIEAGVTTIGDRAFYNCTALTDVIMGGTVTTIGTYAFRGCTALEEVTVPANVTELKDSAFRACSALATVTFEGDAPTLGNYVFNECATALSINCYEGKTGYDAALWTDYTVSVQHIGQWVVDSEPTCTTDGSRHFYCSYCDETFTETLPGGHKYVDGVCTVCSNVEILHSGTCGSEVNWELDAKGTLTIFGSWEMSGNIAYHAPWYSYRELIYSVVIEDGVRSIGDYAFEDCNNLTSVTIKNSVTRIEDGAFKNCSSLTSITIPDSVYYIGKFAFFNCGGLVSITIPENVSRINASTFSGCSNLMSVTLPSSITGIDQYAFSQCSRLTSITIPERVTYIDDYAFSQCSSLTSITIPEGISSIDAHIFEDCNSLLSITIPDSVERIESYAFSGCSSLKSIAIPEGVDCINYYVFSECSSLTAITIPDSVNRIESYAFSGCSSLTSIKIPEGVSSISQGVFKECSSLKSLTIPESVGQIGHFAFEGCSSLVSIIIPESVNSMGDFVFRECSKLTSITIPDNITSIGDEVFRNCSSLVSIAIPSETTRIGWRAFSGCRSLTSITIHNSVTDIDNYAFEYCNGLQDIYFGGTSVQWTSLGSYRPSAGRIHYSCADAKNHWQTVSEPGRCEKDGYTCERCACGYERNKVITTAPGHIYEDGICTVCGIPEGLEYQVVDNKVIISDYTGSANELVIPDTIEGLPVTGIGDSAFSDCNFISITIPSSVTEIDEFAFYCCYQLESVNFSEGLIRIEESAFQACEKLNNITLPESLRYIGGQAFFCCRGLTEITIPAGVAEIGSSAFDGCGSLIGIWVDEQNTAYSSDSNGVLFNKAKTQLIKVPVSFSTYVIPNSVTSIANYAFDSCALTNVNIGDKVTNIGDFAFNNCNKMTSVTIGRGVTYIGAYAFNACTSLTDVYYSGTQAQWDEISIGANNSCLTNATIHFATSLKITTQPKNTCVAKGETAKVTIKATGTGLTYQWYFKNPTATKFAKSSSTGTSYSVKMSNTVSGRQVYCVVKDSSGNSVTSDVVSLDQVATITVQPENTCVAKGSTAKVTVSAVGKDLTYTWYYKNPTATKFSKSSTTTSSYSVKMSNAVSGRQVYCVVKDKYGNSVKSNTVSLDQRVTITTQPKNTCVAKGTTAKVTVKAVGKDLTYQWYYKNPTATKFAKSSTTTSSYSVKMSNAVSGRQVYCIVKDSYGNSVKSNTVTLDQKVTIVTQPKSVSVAKGSTAKVTVSAIGKDLTYTWYYKNPAATKFSKSSTTTSSYSVKMSAAVSGRQVYCVIKDSYGNSVKTNTVTLKMK